MTVAELIKKLLDECEGDTTKKVDFYVCASTDTCRQIADNDECIDDFIDIDSFEIIEWKPTPFLTIRLKEIEY